MQTVKEMFLEHYSPRQPLSTNDFSKGLFKRDRSEALNMKYIETAPKAYKNLLVLDFDIPEADRALLNLIEEDKVSTPNFCVINPATSHLHAAYILKVGANSEKAQKFAKDVFIKMKVKSGSDMGYTGRTFRNPLATTWHQSYVMRETPYTLEELNALVKDTPKPRRGTENLIKEEVASLGRHNFLFENVRVFAYRNWAKFHSTGMFEILVEEKAWELNAGFSKPIPRADVQSTIRSILSFISDEFSVYDFQNIQRARARKSVKKRNWIADVKVIDVWTAVQEGLSKAEACQLLDINYKAFMNTYKPRAKELGLEF